MGKLKIMWHVFWSEKWMRLSMICSVLLMIVTANILFALIREEYLLNRIADECDLDQAVYFSKATSVPYTREKSEYDNQVDKLLDEMEQNGYPIGKITYLYTYAQAAEENIFLLNYNQTAAEHLKMPLSLGRWFCRDGCNEAILSYQYKKRYGLGDTVPLVITDAGGRHELEVKVIGFLDKSSYLMNFTSSGYVDMSALISKENNAIITSGLEDTNGQVCELGENSGVLIFGMAAQKNEYSEKLMELGAVTAMEEIAENNRENVKNRLYQLIGIDAVLFVLALSGLGSMNFISLYTKRKEYGIYFICGLPKKMVALLTAVTDLLILAAAVIPAVGFCLLYPGIVPNFDFVNVIVMIGLAAVVFIVSFLPFYVMTKRESAVSLIRR